MAGQYTFRVIDSDDPILLERARDDRGKLLKRGVVAPIAFIENVPGHEERQLDRFIVLVPPSDHTTTEGARKELPGSREVNLAPNRSEGVVRPMPYPNQLEFDRTAVYITGAANSGKSTSAGKLMEIWGLLERNKDKKIYCFARMIDPAFKDVRPVPTYIFVEKDEDIEKVLQLKVPDFANSLVVFDDMDSQSRKDLDTHMLNLRDDILRLGRKHLIDIIVVNHQAADYKRTAKCLGECTAWVCYPRGGMSNQIDYIGRNKLSMGKLDVEKLKHLPGARGWAQITCTAPRFVLHELGCYFLE
jgi:hypothetical protein